MRIEVWNGNGGWYWHFKSRNGRIVADAEAFPTKAHAIRAAKACVRAVRGYGCTFPIFQAKKVENQTVLTWV